METDLEYAQAAIDMLPGSVEEIDVFLRAHKIKPTWKCGQCPIDRWLSKWVDHGYPTTYTTLFEAMVYQGRISLPAPVSDYIAWVDFGGGD